MHNPRNMDTHVTLLSVLFIALGLIGLAVAAVVFIAVAGGGWLSGDPEAILITSSIAVAVAGFIAVMSLPTLVAGIGLHRRRPWARTFGLVMAALHLFNLPFGTVLGVYGLWVLLQEESGQLMVSS